MRGEEKATPPSACKLRLPSRKATISAGFDMSIEGDLVTKGDFLIKAHLKGSPRGPELISRLETLNERPLTPFPSLPSPVRKASH